MTRPVRPVSVSLEPVPIHAAPPPELAPDALFAQLPIAAMVTDAAQRVRQVNPAAEQLCAMGSALMLGQPIQRLVRPDAGQAPWPDGRDGRAFLAHDVAAVVGRNRVLLTDLRMVATAPAGHFIWCMTPASETDDQLARRGGRSGRSASATAAMLAHEVKNPLAGIRGAAQLIARSGDARARQFSDLICVEVDRITALIDRMQNFSRQAPLALSAVNIYPPILQALGSVRAAAPASVRFDEQFDPSLPDAAGNHDALVQIMINLLTNAVDAVRGQDMGAVRVRTAFRHGLSIDSSDGARRLPVPIEIRVEDNGPGVDASLAEEMFEPFVTTKKDGRGLGLALVARLARDMGGTVFYRRDRGWTQFRLYLPVTGGAAAAEGA